jgi:hypothetical protein
MRDCSLVQSRYILYTLVQVHRLHVRTTTSRRGYSRSTVPWIK